VKKDIKDEWIRRLRSGDYEQGSWYLHFGDRYCCLGVLCDMAVEAGVIKETKYPHTEVYAYGRSGNDSDFQTQRLPVSVAQWAGLTGTSAAEFKGGSLLIWAHIPPEEDGWEASGRQNLMHLNDNKCSFEEIADVIEVGIEADL